MSFRSPPNQGALTNPAGVCTPLWFRWFLDLVNFINGFVPAGRTITVVTPMTIDGGLSADLSSNRTISPGGLSVTITTAKLTPAGVNGSMTFTNGILTAQTPAT